MFHKSLVIDDVLTLRLPNLNQKMLLAQSCLFVCSTRPVMHQGIHRQLYCFLLKPGGLILSDRQSLPLRQDQEESLKLHMGNALKTKEIQVSIYSHMLVGTLIHHNPIQSCVTYLPPNDIPASIVYLLI